jgi:hypothetical protein
MGNVVNLFQDTEGVEPNNETDDAWSNIGYLQHGLLEHSAGFDDRIHQNTREAASAFNREFAKDWGADSEEDLKPVRRPPGWKPPIDDDDDCPF